MTTPAKATQNGTPAIQRGAWLDGLRFIVACMIVIYHYAEAAPVPLIEFHPVFGRGYLLTNFFLIDSGYVLARIYASQLAEGRITSGAFFTKRFLRVVPSHLVMATALVGLVLLADAFGVTPRHGQWFDWSQLPAQVLLVQSYGVPGGIGWNAPSWSISALLGCYLLFPVLMRLAGRLSGWECIAVGVVFFGIADLLAKQFLGFPVYQMPLRHGFLRALPLFATGILLARLSETLYIPPRLAATLGVTAAIELALVQNLGNQGLISLALMCVIILAAAAIPVARPSKLVQQAALVSFAMYITNEVVRIGWFGVVNVVQARIGLSLPVQWALWACGPLLAVAFAVLFYAVFDGPSQRWLNAPERVERRGRLRRALARRLPRPEAKGFEGPYAQGGGYVEVAVSKGSLSR